MAKAEVGTRLRGLSAALLVLLAIGLVPALVGTLWTLNLTRDVALREAFGQADLLATGTAERLHWQLQDAQAMMAAVADRPRVRALDASDCDPIFQDFRSVSPSYRALALRRLDGTSVCSELKSPPSQQAVAAAPWFQVAVRQDTFHASDGHSGSIDQPWAARLTHPVLDAAGRRVGLLVTPVDLKQLQQRLFAQLPAHATAALVDGSNRVLVRSQRQDERMGKPAADGVARVLDEMRLAAQGQDRAVSQSRQFVEVGIGGVRNLFVVRTVPLSDWAVVCALPEEQTLAVYQASRRQSLAAIVVVVLLAGLAAWRVSRAILVPIRGLARAARSMAAGEAGPRAPETGPSEIREVAREFNRMVQLTAESREQLRASESQYRTLIQNLPVAVLSCTAEGRVEVFNDRTCTLLRMAPSQLQGSSLQDAPWRFVDDEGRPLLPGADPASRLLHSRQPLAPETLGLVERASEQPGRVPPQVHTWVMVTGYPQFDAQGGLLRAIVVLVDVTTQRLAEQLHVAKEAAEAASKAKSAFLSRVSHELRTPLNAINGFSELLLNDERLAVDVKGKLGHVLNAGRHLLSLIEQILDLSRVESGQIQPSMQPVALWPLLEECVAICSPLAQARQITLSLRPPSADNAGLADLWVKGDATRLRQVLMNLLSNGVKYNRPGGRVTVQVRTLAAGPDAAADILLDVVDTGAGLSPAQLQGLFQPFNRLGAERRGIEGHGLGLLISRLLAQSMGGDLTVCSTVDMGSCFSVHLHRSAAPDLGGLPSSAVAPGPAQRAGTGRGPDTPPAVSARPLRVLYIEDNELNMLLMRQIVSLRQDIEFFEATDGLAGVQAVKQLRPDLVLVDIGLPLLDGFGVLEQVRADADTARTPCWAVTADTTAETAERARRSGFERHLTKPLTVSAMLAALDAWARAHPAPPGP